MLARTKFKISAATLATVLRQDAIDGYRCNSLHFHNDQRNIYDTTSFQFVLYTTLRRIIFVGRDILHLAGVAVIRRIIVCS